MYFRESVIFIISAFLSCSTGGLSSKADNQAEFNALCYITRLIESPDKLEKPTFDDRVTGSLRTLGLLNISVAADAWKSLFGPDGTVLFDAQKDPFKGLKEEVREDWRPKWDRWRESAQRYVEVKKEMKIPPEGPNRQTLALKIDNFYIRALAAEAVFEGQRQKANLAHTEAIEFLTTALEGANNTAGKRVTFSAGGYTAGCGTNTGGTVTNPSTGGPGASVKNDMVCICAYVSSGGANNSPCGKGIDLSGGKDYTANPDGGGASQAWTVISEACPKHPDAFPTEHSLEGALAGFFSVLGRDPTCKDNIPGGRYTLGKGHNTAANHCDGATGQSSCVNYIAQLTGNGNGILWVNNIRKAITKLREMRESARLANQTATKIEDLALAAQAELEVAGRLPATVPTLGTKTTAPNVTGAAPTSVPNDPEAFVKGGVPINRFILPWTLFI